MFDTKTNEKIDYLISIVTTGQRDSEPQTQIQTLFSTINNETCEQIKDICNNPQYKDHDQKKRRIHKSLRQT